MKQNLIAKSVLNISSNFQKSISKTRIHSSRMRTIRSSHLLGGGGLLRGVCGGERGVCPGEVSTHGGVCIPACTEADTPM